MFGRICDDRTACKCGRHDSEIFVMGARVGDGDRRAGRGRAEAGVGVSYLFQLLGRAWVW